MHCHLAFYFLDQLRSLTISGWDKNSRFQGQNLSNQLPALQKLEIQQPEIDIEDYGDYRIFSDVMLPGTQPETKKSASTILLDAASKLFTRDTIQASDAEPEFDEALVQIFEDPGRKHQLLLKVRFINKDAFPSMSMVGRPFVPVVSLSPC